jgi:Mg-chelatase subunit ChlD
MIRTRKLQCLPFLICFTFFCLVSSVQAQRFVILDVNAENSPRISARVLPLSEKGDSTRYMSSSFLLRDNGYKTPIESMLVDKQEEQKPISLAVAIDVSNSTSVLGNNLELAKGAVNYLARQNTLSNVEIGVIQFHQRPAIVQDLTTDTSSLLRGLSRIVPTSATNYKSALLHPDNGALSLLSRAQYSKSVLIITDGQDSLTADDITQLTTDRTIRYFVVGVKIPVPNSLRQLASQSGGAVFNNITSLASIENALSATLRLLKGERPLTIEWKVINRCIASHRIELEYPVNHTVVGAEYRLRDDQLTMLDVSSTHYSLGGIKPGTSAPAFITLKAINDDMIVQSASMTGSKQFKLKTEFPLILPKGTTKQIDVEYVPLDSTYNWAKLSLLTDKCDTPSVSLSAGFPGVAPKKLSLSVLKPEKGDIYFTGNVNVIKWEGTPPEDISAIEYSSNGGNSWIVISDKAQTNVLSWTIPDIETTKAKIRITHKQEVNGKVSLMQTAESAMFSILKNTTAVNAIDMKQERVGFRKDSVINKYFFNPNGDKPLTVNSIRFEGGEADEFMVVSYLPPFTIEEGKYGTIELGFMPKGAGLRQTRVIVGTSSGFITHRLYGFGIENAIRTNDVSMGSSPLGEKKIVAKSDVIINSSAKKIDISHIVVLGPDSGQITIESGDAPFTLEPGQARAMTFSFTPTSLGRTTMQFGVIGSDNSEPVIFSVNAEGGDGIPYKKDPTDYRGIAIPTAVMPKAGSIVFGTYNLLGVMAGYAINDNLMVLGGGNLPISFNNQLSTAFSLGFKAGTQISSKLRLAGGYQFAKSIFNKPETEKTESDITMHIPYITATYGDDTARVSVALGYALKRHITIEQPEGFTANASLLALSGDFRIGNRWKLCGEMFSFQTLGNIPIIATVRYIGQTYALDAGLAYVGIATSGSAPSIPLIPVLSAVWTW